MELVVSPTLLKTYATCPRKAQAMYVTKEVKYVQNLAAKRGDTLHTLMESAANNGWDSIQWPEYPNMQHAKGFIDTIWRLKASGWFVQAELQTAIDESWNKTDWFDKAPKSFMRSKIDICATNPLYDYAIVIDWKTGKKYELDTIQLTMNAMCLKPITGLFKYKMMFAYIDSGEVVDHSCELAPVLFNQYISMDMNTMSTVPEAMRDVYDKLYQLDCSLRDDNWPVVKNKFCHWCGVESCPNKK